MFWRYYCRHFLYLNRFLIICQALFLTYQDFFRLVCRSLDDVILSNYQRLVKGYFLRF
nr:MAG TPA: hypothetical protein [Caudoviricetes sp.]